jgi:hypothetical protein
MFTTHLSEVIGQPLPSLKIAGRSGCHVEIVKGNVGLYVKKKSSGLAYNERLRKQAEKQRSFTQRFPEIRWFKCPIVLNEGIEQGGLYSFSMEYAGGNKATDFLADADTGSVRSLSQKFAHYFRSLELVGKLSPSPFEAIRTKNESLLASIHASSICSTALSHKLENYLHSAIPDAPIMLGWCHGDFTLSNMLFGIWHIELIDFLDSFIESPLIDLIKLRQDTRFYWTLQLDEQMAQHQTLKVKIALQYLDRQLAQRVAATPHYNAWHNYLEVYNLARILPYVKEQKEVEFLETNLRMLLK